jgi:multicomponent Na+:H+ antiporter subunit E
MAYAAALIAGAGALWLALSPDPFSFTWLAGGGIAIGVVLLLAWRMRLLDREGAPYFHALGLSMFTLTRLGGVVGSHLALARAALSLDSGFSPALVRLKTRRGDDFARAAYANALALGPGLLTVECDEDSLLVHALVEDDADRLDAAAIERGAWAATGASQAEKGAPA